MDVKPSVLHRRGLPREAKQHQAGSKLKRCDSTALTACICAPDLVLPVFPCLYSLRAGASAESVLRARYGAKGKEILNVAHMYDKYIAWHNTNYLETADEAAKAKAALASALAGAFEPVRLFF